MSLRDKNLSTDTATFCMKENPYKDRFTVIITGTPRGGTSAVAGVVQRLGINIGENLPNNYEDPDFNLRNRENIASVISSRNEAHMIWGFKFPNAAAYLNDFRQDFVNPVLISVERDAVSSMKRIMRVREDDPADVLIGVFKRKLNNAILSKSTGWPTLYVSYEKLVKYKESFVTEIAEFLKVDSGRINITEITEFLQPGSYK